MNALLCEIGHENLILTAKDFTLLHDIAVVLEPFADATDVIQGEFMVTVSCVVLILMVLNNKLGTFLPAKPALSSFLNSAFEQLS